MRLHRRQGEGWGDLARRGPSTQAQGRRGLGIRDQTESRTWESQAFPPGARTPSVWERSPNPALRPWRVAPLACCAAQGKRPTFLSPGDATCRRVVLVARSNTRWLRVEMARGPGDRARSVTPRLGGYSRNPRDFRPRRCPGLPFKQDLRAPESHCFLPSQLRTRSSSPCPATPPPHLCQALLNLP